MSKSISYHTEYLIDDNKESESNNMNQVNLCTYRTELKHSNYKKPNTLEELSQLLKLKDLGSVHVCSTGMNWGYGSKLGNENGTTLIDLSQLKKIAINDSHCVATVEAGVTQKDLYDELSNRNSNLMLSITGSSPLTSIIGNMQGYGYGNGRSTLRIEDVLQVNGFDKNYNYLEGINNSTCKYGSTSTSNSLLFTNKTIITKAKFRLKQIPERLLLVCFSIDNDHKFSNVIKALNYIKSQGLIEGNWSVFSAHRLLAEFDSKVNIHNATDSVIGFEEAKNKLCEFGYTTWVGSYNGVFACYLPSQGTANSVQEFINEKLFGITDRLTFIQVSKKDIIKERQEGNGFSGIKTDEPILSRLRTFSGILKNGSMDIIYWKKKYKSEIRNPDKDKCGFIWYASSLPNDYNLITTFKEKVNQVFLEKNMEPIYVIDGVLPHETYFMISIIYDLDDLREEQKAKDIFKELKTISSKLGIINFKQITPFK